MLFKPEEKDDAKAAEKRKPSLLSRMLKRMVSLTITLVILGGLGYIGWYAFQPKSRRPTGQAPAPIFRCRYWPRRRASRMCRSISTASARFVR